MSLKNKLEPRRFLKVCVIITAYNEEKRIGECLNSLLQQDYKPLEIIVVDDGSTDKTASIAQDHGAIVIQNSHEGTAKSRNKTAAKARGEILVFLDADMTFETDFISKLVSPINEGETKGTFSKLEYVKNWDKPLARVWNWVNNPRLPDKLRVSQDGDEGEDFRAILKEEFDRVGGFDDTGYTDTWSLARKLGYKPKNAPNAVYDHYNPESYSEVFSQAVWIGRRSYKFGIIGDVITLIRSFFVLSLIKGTLMMVQKRELSSVLFQLVYDLGISYGVITRVLYGKKTK